MKLSKISNDQIINGQCDFDPNVEFLGKEVFSYCATLEEIIIPDRVKTIPTGAFMYCTNLKKIDLNNVTRVGDYALMGCTNLEEIIGFDKVIKWGIYALAGCASLEKANFSDQVTIIREGLLESCVKLNEISFSNVKRIDSLALSGCVDLKKIIVNKRIEKIIGDAFLGTDGLKLIYQNQIIDDFDEIELIVRKNGKLDIVTEKVKIKVKS